MISLRLLGYVLLGAWLVYTLGVSAFVAGSYLVMQRGATTRPLRRWIREVAREGMLTFVTQPFLPLFYLVGRRMGGRGGDRPIVLVHGYAQNRIVFVGMARYLAHRGLGPIYALNYPWFADIERIAEGLARFIEDVRSETKAAEVDIVTHSFGGVVALEYLHAAPHPPVRRLVTVAGPHAGVAWRGPLLLGRSGAVMRAGGEFIRGRSGRRVAVPCLSLYSTHDNIVFPSTTSALGHRGARDLAISEAGHLAILFDRPVLDEVARFLLSDEVPTTG